LGLSGKTLPPQLNQGYYKPQVPNNSPPITPPNGFNPQAPRLGNSTINL